MDAMKRTSGYAESQIRLLLSDLKNSSHTVKTKAIKRFQDYIEHFAPEIYDDDVDFMYTGTLDGIKGPGLLYWSGLDSVKHGGQLKRIAAPVISLIRWMISLDAPEGGNIFLERFILLSVSDLKQINFIKHISQNENENKLSKVVSGQSRSGSNDDACTLLAVLARDHRDAETGDEDPIDIDVFLAESKSCREKFNQWIQKSAAEHMSKTIAQFKSTTKNVVREIRPTTWADLTFRPVPLQEGEEGQTETVVVSDEPPPIPDPLGLVDVDLRVTQVLYSSGKLSQKPTTSGGLSGASRRDTTALTARMVQRMQGNAGNISDDSSDDDDDDDVRAPGGGGLAMLGSSKARQASVLLHDKLFSPGLFLTLVHGNASFDDLQTGRQHLHDRLNQQSDQRENLVRSHFGLFVNCAEGLEWLKLFRKGIYKRRESSVGEVQPRNATTSKFQKDGVTGNGRASVTGRRVLGDNGDEKLKRAKKSLEVAKADAQKTLAPILSRMLRSRKIKSADQVLRRLAGTMEHPHRMRQALQRGDYAEVLNIYHHIRAMPVAGSLRILQRIREGADVILKEMKAGCLVRLLTPCSSAEQLLRDTKILRDLDATGVATEDAEIYKDYLKQCFLRQLAHVGDLLKTSYEAFKVDAVQGYGRGMELNTLRNTEVNGTSFKDIANTGYTRRQSFGRRTSFSDTSTGGGVSGHLKSVSRQKARNNSYISMSSVGSAELLGGSVVGKDDDGTVRGDEFDSDSDNDDTLSEFGGNDAINNASEDQCVAQSIQSRIKFVDQLMDILDVWIPCLHRLVAEISLVASAGGVGDGWLNEGFSNRLLADSGRTNNNNNSNSNTSNIGSSYLNRWGPQPSKQLSSCISSFSEIIRQCIMGYSINKGGTVQDLVTSVCSLRGSAATSNDASAALASISNTSSVAAQLASINAQFSKEGESFSFDAIMELPLFLGAIPETNQIAMAKEVSDLYEIMEATLLSSYLPAVPILSTKSPANAAMASKMSTNSTLFGGNLSALAATSLANTVLNKSIKNPSGEVATQLTAGHVYYECMGRLRDIARECEIASAQRIIGRLHDLTMALGNTSDNADQVSGANLSGKTSKSNGWSSGGEAEEHHGSAKKDSDSEFDMDCKRDKTARKSSHVKGQMRRKGLYSPLRIENMANDFDGLVQRCVQKLIVSIRKPMWVAQVILDGVQRAFTCFSEVLRMQSLQIATRVGTASGSGKLSSTSGVTKSADLSPARLNRGKKANTSRKGGTGANARGSVVNIEMQVLEEDLRCFEVSDVVKCRVLVDLLRACVMLRTKTIPTVWKLANAAFPASSVLISSSITAIASPQTVAPAAASGAPAKVATGSLLNKLFASSAGSDAPPPAQPASSSSTSSSSSSAIVTPPSPQLAGTSGAQKGGSSTLLEKLTNSSDSSVLGVAMNNVKEVIAIEDGAAASIVKMKLKTIKMAVLSAYSVIVKQEREDIMKKRRLPTFGVTQPDTTTVKSAVPVHLSKVLMILGHDKTVFYQSLANVTIEQGNVSLSDHDSDQGCTDSDKEDEYNYDDDYSSIVKGEKYAEYFFKEICNCVLITYNEIMQRLSSNTFMTFTQATGGGRSTPTADSNSAAGNDCVYPRSLRQSGEEMEYVKTLLRQVMPSHSQLLAAAPSLSASTGRGSGKEDPVVTTAQLLLDCKIYSMMILNNHRIV